MPASVKSYPCNVCDFISKTKRTMHEHYTQQHKYICPSCNTVLSSRKELKAHILSHAKVPFKMPADPFTIIIKI